MDFTDVIGAGSGGHAIYSLCGLWVACRDEQRIHIFDAISLQEVHVEPFSNSNASLTWSACGRFLGAWDSRTAIVLYHNNEASANRAPVFEVVLETKEALLIASVLVSSSGLIAVLLSSSFGLKLYSPVKDNNARHQNAVFVARASRTWPDNCYIACLLDDNSVSWFDANLACVKTVNMAECIIIRVHAGVIYGYNASSGKICIHDGLTKTTVLDDTIGAKPTSVFVSPDNRLLSILTDTNDQSQQHVLVNAVNRRVIKIALNQLTVFKQLRDGSPYALLSRTQVNNNKMGCRRFCHFDSSSRFLAFSAGSDVEVIDLKTSSKTVLVHDGALPMAGAFAWHPNLPLLLWVNNRPGQVPSLGCWQPSGAHCISIPEALLHTSNNHNSNSVLVEGAGDIWQCSGWHPEGQCALLRNSRRGFVIAVPREPLLNAATIIDDSKNYDDVKAAPSITNELIPA